MKQTICPNDSRAEKKQKTATMKKSFFELIRNLLRFRVMLSYLPFTEQDGYNEGLA
jgi:gamma-glutamylcysteine synthetase